MEMEPEYQEVFGDYGDGTKSTVDEGENDPDIAQPEGEPEVHQEAVEEPERKGDAPTAVEEENPPPQDQNPTQTPEERHAQAQARRMREEAQREAAYQAKIDKIYADAYAGQTNPFTGRAIESEKEFKEYMAAKQRQEQEQSLQNAGIQPRVIEQLVDQRVSQHPAVLEAQRAAEAARAEQARAAEAQALSAIAQELTKISAIDPSIKTLEDIAKMPTAADFNRYVQQGLSIEEAFYLANRTSLEQKRQAAAKQAAINQTRSKQGLLSGAGDGGAGDSVPADAAAEYKAFMPDASDDEIAKAWAKYKKSLR